MMLRSTSSHHCKTRHSTPLLPSNRRLRSVCPAASTEQTKSTSSAEKKTFHHGITYTAYEVNTFAMKFMTSGVRVLVDPWFVGQLTFAEQDWIYKASKRVIGKNVKVNMQDIAAETDVLILTQGLDDHCHMPTLREFPKHVPVIANPAAADRIRPLGFKNIQVIDHNQTVEVAGGKLKITATQGALVGPPWSKRQNGLVFREAASDSSNKAPTSVYFEPHCDFDEASLRKMAPVDIVVSPYVTTSLGVGDVAYPLVMGDINLVKLLKILKPKVYVPLLNSELDHVGPLAQLLTDRGDLDNFKSQLQSEGMSNIRIESPAPPGEALAIAL